MEYPAIHHINAKFMASNWRTQMAKNILRLYQVFLHYRRPVSLAIDMVLIALANYLAF